MILGSARATPRVIEVLFPLQKIGWPPGKRSMKTIFYKLTTYWLRGPWWAPFMYSLLFIFCIALRPDLVDQIFGQDADLSKRIAVTGQFELQKSKKSPYILIGKDGENLYLSCYPQMQWSSCLSDLPVFGQQMDVIYSPMKYRWLRKFDGVDGIVLQVSWNKHNIVGESSRIKDLGPKDHSFSVKILIAALTVIQILLFLIASILLGSGIFSSVQRLSRRK